MSEIKLDMFPLEDGAEYLLELRNSETGEISHRIGMWLGFEFMSDLDANDDDFLKGNVVVGYAKIPTDQIDRSGRE